MFFGILLNLKTQHFPDWCHYQGTSAPIFPVFSFTEGKKSANSGLSFIAFIFNVILYYKGNVLALWSGEERQSYFPFKMETRMSKMSLAKHKHVFCNLSIDSLGSNLKLMSSINDQCNSNVPSKV